MLFLISLLIVRAYVHVCVSECVRGCNTELLLNVLPIILLSTTGKANSFAFDGNERVALNNIYEYWADAD